MLGVVGNQIRAHQQYADTAFGGLRFDQLRQLIDVIMQARLHARVIHADFRVFKRRGNLEVSGVFRQHVFGVAVNQKHHQVLNVFL